MNNETIEALIGNEKEWRRHLINEIKCVKTEQIKQGKAISALKVKAGLWGAIAGAAAGAVIYLKTII